jgi:Cu(I)/Ag(I) efflux system membrane fusion protein
MKIKPVLILAAGVLIGASAIYFGPLRKAQAPAKAEAAGGAGTQGETPKKEGKVLYWRAPMDPTEIYDHPGKSKMGMDLVPVYEGEEAGGAGSITINPVVEQNMNLRTAPVERRDLPLTLRAFGKVAYAQDREYAVNTKFSGWIEKLYVNKVGQNIGRGDPLLEIYSPELVSTQEEYLLAAKNYKALSESPFETVRRGAAEVLAASRERLKYWDISDDEVARIEKSGSARRTILLRSDLAGIVTHKSVVEGDKVGPGMDLFRIADIRRVWVEASVYESELPLLAVGQTAELTLDYQPSVKLEGRIDFIYPYIDPRSQANNVRLAFDNPDLTLKPDMFATVRINVPAAKGALAVPSEAVLRSGTRDIVFVARGGGIFEPREVKTGVESDDGFIQVLSGLFDGEQVVASGQFLLDSESQTREAIAKLRAAAASRAAQKGEGMVMAPSTGTGEKTPESKMPMPEGQPMTSQQKTPAVAVKLAVDPDKLYACPMHPDFITTDPKASCPDCGMKVVPVKTLGDKVKLDKAEFYTCVMHPDFLTTDPNGRCPECGMKVVKAGHK